MARLQHRQPNRIQTSRGTHLGASKVLITGRNAFKSGLEMLAVGGLAAAVAYAVGALLKGIGG